MKLSAIIARVLAQFRSGALDPAYRYGSTYEGKYEPTGNRITGFVTDCGQDKRFPPAAIVAVRDGADAGATDELERVGLGWRFSLSFPSLFTPDDIVRDCIKVFAVDHRGARSELKIEGAVQLSYVREALAPPSETELVIDFMQGGNSREHLLEGWSNPEPTHTWTDGKRGTIALKFRSPGSRYRVEILAWPFVVANSLPQQAVQVSIDDTLIHTFIVDFGQKLLEFDIARELTTHGEATLRFDFLDAVRPCDVTGEKDGRTVALAFKRLTLKRRLDDSSFV